MRGCEEMYEETVDRSKIMNISSLIVVTVSQTTHLVFFIVDAAINNHRLHHGSAARQHTPYKPLYDSCSYYSLRYGGLATSWTTSLEVPV